MRWRPPRSCGSSEATCQEARSCHIRNWPINLSMQPFPPFKITVVISLWQGNSDLNHSCPTVHLSCTWWALNMSSMLLVSWGTTFPILKSKASPCKPTQVCIHHWLNCKPCAFSHHCLFTTLYLHKQRYGFLPGSMQSWMSEASPISG